MNYLFYGTEKFLIEKEIENIINNNNIDKINISKYDLEINTINEILEDINTISLFSSNKFIIVYNANIFTKSISKDINNIDSLEEYLKIKNNDIYLIFINNSEKIDNNNKIVKLIKNNGIVKEFNEEKDITSNVKKMLGNYKIDSNAMTLLINRVGNNLELLNQEIEKLKIYKIDDKIITKEDIISLVTENNSVDIFKFIDNIINKNKTKVFEDYNKLIKNNEEPIKLIALLASKFRLMYQVSILYKQGFNEEKISDMLKVHKYPVHLALLASSKYSNNILLKNLNDLADLDYTIKTGLKNENLAFELFILNL